MKTKTKQNKKREEYIERERERVVVISIETVCAVFIEQIIIIISAGPFIIHTHSGSQFIH